MHFDLIQEESDGIANQIITRATIHLKGINRPPITTYGLWDTGSSHSGISSKYVEQYRLPMIGYSVVLTGGCNDPSLENPENLRPTWYTDIEIDNKLYFPGLYVHDAGYFDVDGTIGLLIGMDIIGLGNFCAESLRDSTKLTFRVPIRYKI